MLNLLFISGCYVAIEREFVISCDDNFVFVRQSGKPRVELTNLIQETATSEVTGVDLDIQIGKLNYLNYLYLFHRCTVVGNPGGSLHFYVTIFRTLHPVCIYDLLCSWGRKETNFGTSLKYILVIPSSRIQIIRKKIGNEI
jgi:hypothetical protein